MPGGALIRDAGRAILGAVGISGAPPDWWRNREDTPRQQLWHVVRAFLTMPSGVDR